MSSSFPRRRRRCGRRCKRILPTPQIPDRLRLRRSVQSLKQPIHPSTSRFQFLTLHTEDVVPGDAPGGSRVDARQVEGVGGEEGEDGGKAAGLGV